MFSWLPDAISTYAADIDGVMKFIYYLVGVWFIAVEVIFFYFIFTNRKRAGKKAVYFAGDSWKQLKWVLVPVIAVLICDLVIEARGHDVWVNVKESLPEPALEVNVIGKQFAWDFEHPGKDGALGTDDDIKSESKLYVPIGSVVHYNLTSIDVLHSFFIPGFRLKQDAVPGRNIKGWFEATHEGVFPIACAEICGFGHTKMFGEIHVLSEEAFAKWVEEYEVVEEW